MWHYQYSDELYHYGVKGMKWGVRRYQNKDGTLTAAGKKRIGKEYTKSAKKVASRLHKNRNQMVYNANRKTNDELNSWAIEEFNTEQEKRYGENFARREAYMDDYDDMSNRLLSKNLDKALHEFYLSDKDYQRCENLVEKYNMTKWHDLAASNSNMVNELRRRVEED